MSDIKENKRSAILAAALELFAENGFHCSPVSLIAENAKVSVGSIYRYFKDKDEIIHGLHNEINLTLKEAIEQGVDRTADRSEQFVRLMKNLFQYLLDHPEEFRFLEQYFSSPYGIDKKREKILGVGSPGEKTPFLDIFNDKLVNFKSLPKPVFHAMVFGPIIYLVRDSLLGLITLDQELVEKMARTCWDAVTH